jgi:hypothetical protein
MQLPEYISTRFPGLRLTPPLFYNWPIGIRFELGTDQEGMTYDEVVLYRASILYEAAFGPSDLGFIVSGEMQHASIRGGGLRIRRGRQSSLCRTVFQLSKRHSLGLGDPAGRQRLITDEDDDTRETTTLRWAEIAPRRIGYKLIQQAKANDDYHLRRPRTDDRVYFVNRTRNIILHMYDDRGLDLIARHRSDLQAIYDAHKSWVLDYDRERIGRVFEQMEE